MIRRLAWTVWGAVEYALFPVFVAIWLLDAALKTLDGLAVTP